MNTWCIFCIKLSDMFLVTTVLLSLVSESGSVYQWHQLNIPLEHIPYFFRNNALLKKLCAQDSSCPFQHHLATRKCWGYEKGQGCPENERMLMPQCPDSSRGWTQDKASQLDSFWKAADFGYIKERRDEMMAICEPEPGGEMDSSLHCAKYTRYCRATNLYIDFRTLNTAGSRERYRENVFESGQIGGYCKFYSSTLIAQNEHKSPLQSWYAELEKYTALDFKPGPQSQQCDVFIEKPTYFIKLDAGVNMFHHFCDFINLYVSQHVNNSFSLDVNIVMWDTSEMHYGDFFHDTWKAFSQHPIIPLTEFDGKRVCFKEAVFSLLARMRFGMYYNMPLIPGCYGSGLFRAFSQHALHRLNKTQEGPLETKIRITLQSRNTKYRKIMNEQELVNAMKSVGEYEVQVIDFNPRNVSFLDQLQISSNTDIFIGMHGAGLTHFLFLPDWAVGFELYNCEDPSCYYDLSRLRGIKYMTWEKKDTLIQEDEGHHPTLGAHAKFTNYAFDIEEFMRLIHKAADHVRDHTDFIAKRKSKYSLKLSASAHKKEEL